MIKSPEERLQDYSASKLMFNMVADCHQIYQPSSGHRQVADLCSLLIFITFHHKKGN